MMDRETLKFLLKQPIPKIIGRLNTLTINKMYRILKININKKTVLPSDYSFPAIRNSFIDTNTIDFSKLKKEVVGYHINNYISHKFDLLGSGWIKYSYQTEPLGIEGVKFKIPDFCHEQNENLIDCIVPENQRKNARKIWNLLSKDYQPIDWQRDYKSGYRWDAKKPSSQQRNNLPEGADLKMSWELSRMQFLPQLATFAVAFPNSRKRIINEFKDILLDFISTNIPNHGVNWVCTMDVAIRATNILVAYDILQQLDGNGILSGEFKLILEKNIFEHGLFIINNLEYSEIITSNHYLSNVCGLIFIAAYLDEDKYTNAWLTFSIQEVLKEFPKQFYKDGGNFEASTSYHRLSSEMMIYTFALLQKVLGKKEHVFNEIEKIKWNIKPKLNWKSIKDLPNLVKEKETHLRLFKTGKFTFDIIKPNGEIPQFGDNDSGRFLKFTPIGSFITNIQAEEKYHNLKGYNAHFKNSLSDLYFDENMLDHKSLLAGYSGIFKNQEFRKYGEVLPLEKSIIETLANKQRLIAASEKDILINPIKYNYKDLNYQKTFIYELNHSINLNNIETSYYPDFGIYVFKSFKDDFYLSIFFGDNGQNGLGGHSHNDKLSFELYQKGASIFIDPGTYLYTPFPQIRNKFRSVSAHNCPVHNNKEVDDFKEGIKGVFRLFNTHRCTVLFAENNELNLLLEYKGVKHIRSFNIEMNKVIIKDRSNIRFVQNFFSADEFSNGYGKLTKFESVNISQ
ncbi:MAG: hypothetical protein GY834_09735 [Bacteroidetes bacterium]|nr:hypothetical protein [Bacteroidota bacterium]